jgi:hypothetical protein
MDDSSFIGSFDLSSDSEVETNTSRTEQSEADFQAQKASWKPKVDSREVLLVVDRINVGATPV